MGRPLHTAEWKTLVKEKPELDGFTWRVLRFDAKVAEGTASTYEKAERAADLELMKLVIAPAKRAGRKYQFSQLMQQYRRARPNLVLYVMQCLAMDESSRSREDCVKQAAEQEQFIADKTQEGWRTDPPTHGRALPAEVVAGRIWDAALSAGYVGTKAASKGEALFGYWWHEQDAEPGIWTKVDGMWNCRPLKHLEALYEQSLKAKPVLKKAAGK